MVATRLASLPKVSPALMRTPPRPKCDLEAEKAAYSGLELRAALDCKDAVIKARDQHIAGLQRTTRVREKAAAEAVAASK